MTLHIAHGDILTTYNIDGFCHQVNCLTVKSHGLSAKVAEKYPWADIYRFRVKVRVRNLATSETRGVPGTIRVFARTNFPAVICFQSQWDFGRCDNIRHRQIPPYIDSKENRQKWFQSCLDQLGTMNFQTVAFPWKIGCGLAGGDWTRYLHMIKTFVKTYNKNVIIVIPTQTP